MVEPICRVVWGVHERADRENLFTKQTWSRHGIAGWYRRTATRVKENHPGSESSGRFNTKTSDLTTPLSKCSRRVIDIRRSCSRSLFEPSVSSPRGDTRNTVSMLIIRPQSGQAVRANATSPPHRPRLEKGLPFIGTLVAFVDRGFADLPLLKRPARYPHGLLGQCCCSLSTKLFPFPWIVFTVKPSRGRNLWLPISVDFADVSCES